MTSLPRQHGTDLAPSCDRCGRVPEEAAILFDRRTLAAVCVACLTPEEKGRVCAGEWPLEEGESSR